MAIRDLPARVSSRADSGQKRDRDAELTKGRAYGLAQRLHLQYSRFLRNGKLEMPSPRPSRHSQNFLEIMLMIILITIVALSILLIMGTDLRLFVNDLLSTWFPAQPAGS